MFKPLTQQLQERLGGFGSVAELGAPLPETLIRMSLTPQSVASSGIVPTAETETALSLLGRLIRLEPQTEALVERKRWLIERLTPLLTEVDEFINCVEENRKQSLTDELVRIRRECRQQSNFCDQLRGDLAAAELRLQNVAGKQEEASQILQGLKLMEQRGGHVPKWPTQNELAAWQRRVREAQARVTAANQEAVTALNERNDAMRRVEPATRELERLGNEEIRLKHQLDGGEFYDAELGLSNRPSGNVAG
jgi:chromosome segregation ATPase